MTVNDALTALFDRKRRAMVGALADALDISKDMLRQVIADWNDYDESTRPGNTPKPRPKDYSTPRYRAVIATNEYGEFIPGMLFPALMDFCQAVEKWPIIKSAAHVRGICRRRSKLPCDKASR